MALRSLHRGPRRLTLFWRVAITNIAVVAAATTLLVLSPATISSPARVDELAVLGVGLVATLSVNLLLLRRWFAPLGHLRQAMEGADLIESAGPIADGRADADVARLTGSFIEMLDRLRAERLESGRRAIHAQEEERRRIARELHDEIGQRLTGLLLELDRAAGAVGERRGQLDLARETARSALEHVRVVAQQLRPVALDDLGLGPALAALGDRLGQLTGTRIDHELQHALPALTPDAELTIYRVAQEGITNAVRHAGCSRVGLRLGAADDVVVLEVSDDGRGIGAARPGTGLRGMAERALLVDADLAVSSEPGRGTRLQLEVPVEAAA